MQRYDTLWNPRRTLVRIPLAGQSFACTHCTMANIIGRDKAYEEKYNNRTA